MNLALLVGLLLAGDTLTPVKVGALSFKAPQDWALSEEETGKEWASQDDKGKLAVSAFPVSPVRTARVCLKQLLTAVGAEGFKDTEVAGSPAAKKVMTDFVGEGEGAKKAENKVTTTTVLGCNGKVKWVLTYTASTAEAARFGPILKRVLDSMSYGK